MKNDDVNRLSTTISAEATDINAEQSSYINYKRYILDFREYLSFQLEVVYQVLWLFNHNYLLMYDMRQLRLDPLYLKKNNFSQYVLVPNLFIYWFFLHPNVTGNLQLPMYSLFNIIYFSYFFIFITVMSPYTKFTLPITFYHIIVAIYRTVELFDASIGVLITFILVIHSAIFLFQALEHQSLWQRYNFSKEDIEYNLIARSNALSFISHECRTPLHCILSTIELLKNDDRLISEHKKSLSSLQVMGMFLLEHLNGMLFLAKAERKELLFDARSFSLRDSLTKTISLAQTMAENFNCSIELKMSKYLQKIAHVTTDEVRLRQVLLNIISNGIKHTVNGKVTVFADWCSDIRQPELPSHSFCACSPKSETFSFQQESSSNTNIPEGLSFTITDNGEGMDSLFMGRIFDMYSQGDRQPSSNSDGMSGMGLGLTICMRLVEMMRGGIWVSSKKYQGTIFTICVPACHGTTNGSILQDTLSESEALSSPFSVDETCNISVLYCDDHAINRKLLKKQLSHLGFNRLLECTNGFDAVNTYAVLLESGKPPDYILLDMHTPLLNGEDAAFKIRSLARENNISLPYVVIITADASSSTQCRLRSLDYVSRVLLKPCSLKSLRCCTVEALKFFKECNAISGSFNLSPSQHLHNGMNSIRRSQSRDTIQSKASPCRYNLRSRNNK